MARDHVRLQAQRELRAYGLPTVRGVHDECSSRCGSRVFVSLGDRERLQEHQTIHDCNDIKESRVAVFLLHVRVLAVSNLTPSVIDQEETVVDNTYTSELEPHLRLAVLRCHLGQHLLFRPWYGIYDDLRVSRVVAPEPTTRVRT